MARIDVLHHAFNVGVFDKDKLHRVDVERMRLAAERQTNLLCDSIGKGFMRPGTQYLATLPGDTRPIEFIAGNDQAATLLLSDLAMRVHDGQTDTLVTRVAVATSVSAGDFSGAGTWTLAATAGQATTISGGLLNLTARAHGGRAKATQTVTVAAPDRGVEHAMRILVTRGPVTLKIGSTSGGSEYLPGSAETVLRKGTHSIAFTPTADFFLEFYSEDQNLKTVDSCQIEAAGVMVLPTNWPLAALQTIRGAQSLDVLFCAAEGYKEQRVERRGDRSWSVCDYDHSDGPFQVSRSATVKLTPSVTESNGTLTASAPFFTAAHVGALFRLFHEGLAINTFIAGENQYTPAFPVTGITEANFEERKYTYTIAGTWAGTLRNRRSFDGEFGSYHDMRRAQTVATIDITANASFTNDDNDDNVDEWVKIGIPAGLYTSGEASVAIQYPNGGGYGICRVVSFVSSTVVNIEILVPFKGTGATDDWRQSRYDGVNGYPAAVGFDAGRLVWVGNDLFDASESDAYEGFDENVTGDAGPISRSIALGGRNDARWVLGLSSLMIGCDSRIANVRASSLDEIITPTNLGVKSSGKIGAAPISPLELADDRGLFVQASGNSIYEITWAPDKARYITAPFSKLTKELFQTQIRGLTGQVLPDQRIWVANTDADAVCIIFEPSEEVLAAHVPISTSVVGDYFRAFSCLPGTDQDRLYAVVKRVVNGSTVYLFEKFAKDTEAAPLTNCKVMDAHVAGTGAHSAVITGLGHLEGRTVVAWVDGAPVVDSTITDKSLDNSKLFVVSGGQITLPVAPTQAWCVGLRYVVEYKSARLAYGVPNYTPMLKNKGIGNLGILLADYVRDGVRFGVAGSTDFNAPWNLPEIDASGTAVASNAVIIGPDDDENEFMAGSELGLDLRICITGASPKPFSLLSLVMAIETKN